MYFAFDTNNSETIITYYFILNWAIYELYATMQGL